MTLSTWLFTQTVTWLPFLNGDPFVHLIFNEAPVPSRETPFPLWRYIVTIMGSGPIMFWGIAMAISLLSGEWSKAKSVRREAWVSTHVLLTTAPLLGWIMKQLFESEFGGCYHEVTSLTSSNLWSAATFGTSVPEWFCYAWIPISVVLFLLVSDATFYWTHRSWHTPWLYEHSHYYHHLCRPTTSFAGHAADIFEIVLTGYANTLVPALVFPIPTRVFVACSFFNQFWSIWLHCARATRIPGGFIADNRSHVVHHHYGQRNYNFALYFTFWDKFCGTFRDQLPLGKKFFEDSIDSAQDEAIVDYAIQAKQL